MQGQIDRSTRGLAGGEGRVKRVYEEAGGKMRGSADGGGRSGSFER